MSIQPKEHSGKPHGFVSRIHHWFKDEHAVGLDLSDGHIAAAHFARRKGELTLNALAAETVKTGLSLKEQAQCLHAFWKTHNFPTRTVCTSLHSPSLIVRSFSYTNVLEDELKNVLSLEAEEALQLSAEEVSFSWQLNPPSDRKNEISGALIAVPRRIVREHVRMIQMAGLYPVNVEIACSAIINLYAFTHPRISDPICLVSLTPRMAGIVILSGNFTWPRIIFSSDQTGWASNAGYLAENIESALLHYQLRLKGNPVSKLLLTGNGDTEKLEASLREKLNLPVEIWNPFENGGMPLGRQLQKEELPGGVQRLTNVAIALGLGLHYPQKEL